MVLANPTYVHQSKLATRTAAMQEALVRTFSVNIGCVQHAYALEDNRCS
jgi:hypothetical protein